MNVQAARDDAGGLRGFQIVEGLDEECEKVAERAISLLAAEPVKAGRYTVIADPLLAGVLAHEAFGHLSEADLVYENPQLREMMELGRRFGPDHLAIVDDPALEDQAGHYRYDDEGTPARRTYLIQHGILTSRLHSRETAARMGEEPTGNARALSFEHQPIVRMSNTYIEPRQWSFDDLLAGTGEGLYARGTMGGQTNGEMFTFSAEEAFLIRDGRIAERVRDVVLTGNVFETLANIDAVGNDLVFYGGLGGCGKGGQSPLRVATGAPHIRIRNCLVGGR
jgi:TldD protein